MTQTPETQARRETDPIHELAEILDINIWYRHHETCPTCGIVLREMHPEENLVPHWTGTCKPAEEISNVRE